MPRGPRIPTKRTKTYTGCWTCRDRGVKCDLARPHCLRCTRSKRACQGYGIRLLWMDQQNELPQRRLFSEPSRHNPVYTESYIDAALEDIEPPEHVCDVQIAPFTAFRLSRRDESRCPEEETPLFQRERTSHEDSRKSLHLHNHSSSSTSPSTLLSDVKLRILPLLQPFLASATVEERKLFRHWVSYLSGVFLPTPRSDNPFRTIFIPLALASAGSSAHSSGSASLLHCIYAVAAFNIAQQNCNEYHIIATKHQEISLRYLRQSINESAEGQQDAILAAIILTSTIEIITGIASTWRIHIRGGREWLRSQKSSWKDSYNTRTLYQIFQCIEMFGHSHCSQKDWEIRGERPEHYRIQPMSRKDCSEGNSEYCLDEIFGIPEDLFEALNHMNHLRHRQSSGLSDCELSSIEAKILNAKPDMSPLQKPSSITERLGTHHALVYYYACQIYLQRDLYQVPPLEMQELVSQCLNHLEEINAIERTVDVCGLLWPVFITACEAEDPDLRERVLPLFEKGDKLGVGSIKRAKKLVQEVWRHRDQSGEHAASHRHELMERLGFDVLLA